ncbi:hypothetical protein DLE60_22655 [Micromonospora globispora]|uniref:Exo-alpha-sialidase n=1 Tax=Micromonospora globispora TaxID=1450148 RepID=A0A317JSB4_9ACTN|nr:hypothetical protein [Micromonospora globispora]PWU43230.1 hypothetical protein DLJ46_32500 [Micromonospora globispora]PWU58276.1 hypothetical protein DLE60_22655 [Micromonospora globispora]RQW88987.1 hypothetical protein DKL51_24075 [Micromonospora globispora]
MRYLAGSESPTYWTSTDGGAIWRQPTIRQVDALPAGWSYLSEEGSLAAFDPATGDLARAPLPGRMRAEHPLDLPDAAGIWVITAESAPVPSPRPTTSFTLEGWMVAMVTRDGGRTWEKHRIPDAITRREGGGFGFSANQFATADGRTVYAIEKLKGRVRVYVSTDGAAT